MTVLIPVSIWIGSQLHRRITFAGIGRGGTTGLRLLAIMLSGYALNLAPLAILVDRVGAPHLEHHRPTT